MRQRRRVVSNAPAAAATAAQNRCRWLAASGVGVLLLAIYLLTHGGEFYTADGLIMYRTTEALATNQTIAIEPIPEHRFQVLEGQHGNYYSKYGLGQPLLATAPFILGSAVREVVAVRKEAVVAQLYFVSLFNQVVTAITGALVLLLGTRLRYGVWLSATLALAWGLTTPAWPYFKTYFSEPLFTMCLIAAALGLIAYHQTPGRGRFAWLALAGLALGYSVLTRVSGVIYVPLFLGYGVWAASTHPEWQPVRSLAASVRRRRAAGTPQPEPRRWAPALAAAVAAFGIPFLACVALLLWHNVARFGHPFDNGYSEETFSTPLLTGLRGLLFSPGKSLLLYAPLSLLAIVAAPRFWRHDRAAAALFGSVALVTLVQTAKWWTWWGGWSWGPRLLMPLLPFAILTLGPLLREARWSRSAAWLLAAVGFVVAILGTLLNYNGPLIDLHNRFATISNEPAEPAIYYKFGFSPILEHARDLWDRQHVSVVTFDLQRLGFTGEFQALFLVMLVALFVTAAVLLALACRELRRLDGAVTGTAAPSAAGLPQEARANQHAAGRHE